LAGKGTNKYGYTRQDRKTSGIVLTRTPQSQSNNLKISTDERSQASNKEEKPKWTDKVVAYFTIILTISTIGLWYFAWKQSRDTKTSIDISEKAFLTAQRPWLAISASLQSGLTWDENGARISIRYVVKNIGKGPAFEVRILPVHYLEGFAIAKQETSALAEALRTYPLDTMPGDIIFPGEEVSKPYELWVQNPTIELATKKHAPFFRPFIVICADYTSRITMKRHRIAKAIYVIRNHPVGTLVFEPINWKEALSLEELDLHIDISSTIAD